MAQSLLRRLVSFAQDRKAGRPDRRRCRPSLETQEVRIMPHGLSVFSPPLDLSPTLGTPLASSPTGSAGTTAGAAALNPLAPAYSSLPGARATLYLDFDGDFEAQWGSSTNITTPAFDTDNDPTSFSASELAAIHDVWANVAEDYAPFNINVTTVDPGSYPDGVALKVVIGGDGAWCGGGGGISWPGSCGDPSAPNASFVFSVRPADLPNP